MTPVSGGSDEGLGRWVPSKAWGQNYLINTGVIEKIVDEIPAQALPVIEIGSGRGALTTALLARDYRVIAIEPHRESCAYLQSRYDSDPRFSLLEEDATQVDYSELTTGRRAAVVGNLPYCVAARILFALIRTASTGSPWVLMFQREVAQRIVSPPHSREYGLLSVVSQLAAECRICFHVSPGSFSPAPKITSTVVRFEPFPDRNIDWNALSSWLARIFSLRRKQMGNILGSLLSADQLAELRAEPPFSLQDRPEQLTPQEHLALFNRFKR